MVAEQVPLIKHMQKRLEDFKLNRYMHKRKIELLEKQVKEVYDMRDTFGNELATRLDKSDNDVNIMEERTDIVVQETQTKFTEIDQVSRNK